MSSDDDDPRNGLIVWDLDDRRVVAERVGDALPLLRAIAPHPDGRRVFTASDTIQCWDLEAGGASEIVGRDEVSAGYGAHKLVVSPDGARLLVVYRNLVQCISLAG